MNVPNLQPTQISLQLHTATLDYIADPLAYFATLQQQDSVRQERVLLESAEIQSRQHLKSLMIAQASLKLTCVGSEVKVSCITENGQLFLPYLKTQLAPYFNCQAARSSDSQKNTTTKTELIFQLKEPYKNQANQANPILLPLRALQKIACAHPHPFANFLGGVFGYDLLASFTPLPVVKMAENQCPDYQFYLAEQLLIIDHQHQQTECLSLLPISSTNQNEAARTERLLAQQTDLIQLAANPMAKAKTKTKAPNFKSFFPRKNNQQTALACPPDSLYQQQVATLKNKIHQGEAFQYVPSRCFSMPCYRPLLSYQKLKTLNPSPYMFYIQTCAFDLFGASPESALKFNADTRQAELYPIAGTRKRALNPAGDLQLDQDSKIEFELRTNDKECAEHMMLVDLARNDLARIVCPHTLHVADLLKVDRYSHVMHLVSRVVGQLKPEFDALDAYQACMNMGTLMGAPKYLAAQEIRLVEQKRRGSYGGAVGYLTGAGHLDTCIVIRSAFVQNNIAYVQAGAGVVAQSDPQLECLETHQKAQAVLQAIQQAESYQEQAVC